MRKKQCAFRNRLRLLALMLAVFFCLSAGMSGTLAKTEACTVPNVFTSQASGGEGGGESYTSVTVLKVWAGDEGMNRPAEVRVQLYRNGKAYGDFIALNAANNWRHTWRGLADQYTWTVDEVDIPEGYTKGISRQGNSWTVTNTWAGIVPVPPVVTPSPPPTDTPNPSGPPDNPGDDMVVISGVKSWRHGNNPENAWPKAITVHVKNGAAVMETLTVTAADGWRYFAVLPKYDSRGAEIQYTVSEDPVPGYRAAVSGYNLTNVHESGGDGGPQTGDNNTMMLWFALMLGSAFALRILLCNVTIRREKRT